MLSAGPSKSARNGVQVTAECITAKSRRFEWNRASSAKRVANTGYVAKATLAQLYYQFR